MSDSFVRHLIAFLALLLAVVVFSAGYIAGANSWWWIGFSLIFIYMITYKLVDM